MQRALWSTERSITNNRRELYDQQQGGLWLTILGRVYDWLQRPVIVLSPAGVRFSGEEGRREGGLCPSMSTVLSFWWWTTQKFGPTIQPRIFCDKMKNSKDKFLAIIFSRLTQFWWKEYGRLKNWGKNINHKRKQAEDWKGDRPSKSKKNSPIIDGA